MPLPDNELKDNRFSALSALLAHTNAEITRYRDYEWKVTMWSLAMLIGASGIQRLGGGDTMVDIALSTFTILVAVCGVWYLQIIHSRFIWQMKLRRKIESLFGFFSSEVYETNDLPDPWRTKTLLPENWQDTVPTFWHGANLIIACWLMIGIAEVYVLAFIWIGNG